MIYHENRLPTDNSNEISCLVCYFLKSSQLSKLLAAANYVMLYGFNSQNVRIMNPEDCDHTVSTEAV